MFREGAEALPYVITHTIAQNREAFPLRGRWHLRKQMTDEVFRGAVHSSFLISNFSFTRIYSLG